MLQNTKNKKCPCCVTELPNCNFNKNNSRKDGLTVYCRKCITEKSKIIRKKHNKKRTEYNKKYREENHDKYNEYARNYYKRNSKKLQNNAQKWRDGNGLFSYIHAVAKHRAKKKNLDYELSSGIIEDLCNKQKSCCAITKINFDIKKINNCRNRPYIPSVDRIDNTKGYLKNNVQLVCNIVNKAKNEFTQEIFDQMCKARVEVLNG